jgi:hypothetical protein
MGVDISLFLLDDVTMNVMMMLIIIHYQLFFDTSLVQFSCCGVCFSDTVEIQYRTTICLFNIQKRQRQRRKLWNYSIYKIYNIEITYYGTQLNFLGHLFIRGGSCNGGSDLKAYQFMYRYGITDDTCAPLFMGLNWLRGFTVAAMTDVEDVRKHQCCVPGRAAAPLFHGDLNHLYYIIYLHAITNSFFMYIRLHLHSKI